MSLSNGHRSIIKNAAFVYASLLTNQVSRAAYVVVVARFLGPELYGLLAYGQAWYMAFLPLSLFGLGTLLVRAVGRDREEGSRVAKNVAAIRLVTILVTAAVSGITGILVSDSPVISTLMVIFAIALAGRATAQWADDMFQAYEVNHFSFKQAQIFRTSEVLLGIVVALLTHDVVWVAAWHAAVWVAQGARGLLLVVRHLQPLTPRWHWPEIRFLLIAGIPLSFSNVCEALMRQSGIIFYKGADAADELIGNFAITLQALMILGSLFAAFSKAALPAVSRSVARGDANHRVYVSAMIRSAFVFGAFSAIWALAIGAEVVEFVLGPQYRIAGEWLWLMLWVLIPFIIQQAVTNALVAHGRYVLIMLLGFFGIVSTVGAVFLLLRLYGFPGVIAGMLTGFSAYAAVALLIIVRMRLMENAGDIPKLAAIVTLTVSAYLAAAPYRPWLAAIAATVVLASGIVLFGVIKESEKKAVLSLIRRRN